MYQILNRIRNYAAVNFMLDHLNIIFNKSIDTIFRSVTDFKNGRSRIQIIGNKIDFDYRRANVILKEQYLYIDLWGEEIFYK